MKKLLFAIAAFAASMLQAETAEGELIENLSYRQRWPWSEIVDVDYVYKGSAGKVVVVKFRREELAAEL